METHSESKEVLKYADFAEYAIALGVVESPDMKTLRESVVALIRDKKPFAVELGRYENMAYPTIEGIQDPQAHARAQIGLRVMKLWIYKSAGDASSFQQEANDTLDYVINMGFYDIDDALYLIGNKDIDFNKTREKINNL